MFKTICQYLPCPVCKAHAITYMRGLRASDVDTKLKLRRMFFNFHNSVNRRTGKPQFAVKDLVMYRRRNLGVVLHRFVQTYAKKYNTQLLAGAFMPSRSTRRNVADSTLKWFRRYWHIFRH